MSTASNLYEAPAIGMAAQAGVDERADFITKTYLHLAGAIGVFVILEAVLLQAPFTEALVQRMAGGRYSWLIVLGLFMGASWLAESWARSATSLVTQYAGLGLFIVAEAIIFLPLMFVARQMDPATIPAAGLFTLGLFGAMTLIVFVTRKDFSFMRSILIFGGFAALALIICAIVFNMSLGPIFCVAMVALACGYILYDTSNVLHHFRIGQHVAASLALFASVALLFWYILRLVMAFSRD